MRLIKFLFITLLILGGLGYSVYYFGTKYASDKAMDIISEQLENNEQLEEEIIQQIEDDSMLTDFIKEAEHVDESKLPFTTKEEAIRALIGKFSVSELMDIQSQVQKGLSPEEQQALLNEMESKLTEEEILALKVIVYKEINK